MFRTLVLLALTGCYALADLPIAASLAAGETEPAVTRMVGSLMATYHYNGRVADDKIAVQWMESYLNNLDYNHMVFLRADIEEFRALAPTLDDDLRSGRPKLAVARKVYERYQQRVGERVVMARELIDGPIDLTDDEDYLFDRSEAPWPATDAEARDLWRKRIEEQFILGAKSKRSEDDTRTLLKKRYHRLEVDIASSEPMDMLERYLTSYTTIFDPHSVYFKPASQESFDISMKNSLEGIGASLRTVGEYTVVVGLIAGGPAEKGGELMVNDKIIAVAQGDNKAVDIIDLRIDKVVQQIRGKKGTEVRLTVLPADATDPSQTRIVSITRAKVVLADSDADFKIKEVGGKRFAVINVPSFYVDRSGKRSASRDLKRIMVSEMGKVDGVILDLRENGGGSLQEAVLMTGLFIKKGPVVQIKDGEGEIEVLSDRDNKIAWDGPLMVLTSPLSASASEIVAGAIQDYGRGMVVGSKTTHGKGSVQTVIGLTEMMARLSRGTPPRAGALKLTTQKFYRINGESTQVRGVLADVVIPSPWDGMDVYEGDLKHVLPWDEIKATSYTKVNAFEPKFSALQERSDARVAKVDAFREMHEATLERTRLKNEKKISLNLEKRLEDVKDKDKTKDDEAKDNDETKKTDLPDVVLDEALLVMVDSLG